MKKILLSSLLLLAFCESNAQIFDRFVIGVSPTYMQNDKAFNQVGDATYHHEFTTHFNAAVSIKKVVRLGFQNLIINTKREDVKNNYNIFGGFVQGGFSVDEKMRLYGESSYNFGNYCVCGNRDPYKREELNYLGLGVGFDYKINNWVHLDLAFQNYQILNDVENKSNYTQYIIGVDFQLFNR